MKRREKKEVVRIMKSVVLVLSFVEEEESGGGCCGTCIFLEMEGFSSQDKRVTYSSFATQEDTQQYLCSQITSFSGSSNLVYSSS